MSEVRQEVEEQHILSEEMFSEVEHEETTIREEAEEEATMPTVVGMIVGMTTVVGMTTETDRIRDTHIIPFRVLVSDVISKGIALLNAWLNYQ